MAQPPATSIPSQSQLRAELETMVLGDLLGPAGGESEELTERNVRDRYLVGVLAHEAIHLGMGWLSCRGTTREQTGLPADARSLRGWPV